jgi:large subunit ribosomal protein L17
MKGLISSLVEHGRIRTTISKAKELRRHIEKAITLGKKGTLHSRRLLISRIGNVSTAGSVMDQLAVRFKARPGGYTRILKAGARPGDGAEMAFIEFVDYVKSDVASPETVKVDAPNKTKKRVVTRLAGKKRKTLRRLQGQARRQSASS